MSQRPQPHLGGHGSGITSGRGGKPRTKESGVTGQRKGDEVQDVVGFRAQEPSCPSETGSQALEVHGHVRNHSGPMEVDSVALGNRLAVQGKSKKVKAS